MQKYLSHLTALAVLAALLLSACRPGGEPDWLKRSPQDIEHAARGTTVHLAMFGGWEHVNRWMDAYVAPALKRRYNITLIREEVGASEAVSRLRAASGAKDGWTADIVWCNGPALHEALTAGLLYGPFLDRVTSFTKYGDERLADRDFGVKLNGMAAPFGASSSVMVFDADRGTVPPVSFGQLPEWVAAHPGRFTYPDPADHAGAAFLRQAFCAVNGGGDQFMRAFDSELFEAAMARLWNWLDSIHPNLWRQGREFPPSLRALDTLYRDGIIDLTFSPHPLRVERLAAAGRLPRGSTAFVMEEGVLTRPHRLVIPRTAENKPGAITVINYLLSPAAQEEKYNPAQWGDYPILHWDKLPPDIRAVFAAVDVGGASSFEVISRSPQLPELPEVWSDAVVRAWSDRMRGGTLLVP